MIVKVIHTARDEEKSVRRGGLTDTELLAYYIGWNWPSTHEVLYYEDITQGARQPDACPNYVDQLACVQLGSVEGSPLLLANLNSWPQAVTFGMGVWLSGTFFLVLLQLGTGDSSRPLFGVQGQGPALPWHPSASAMNVI